MNTLFKRKEPTNIEYELAAQEGSFALQSAYDTPQSQLSFDVLYWLNDT